MRSRRPLRFTVFLHINNVRPPGNLARSNKETAGRADSRAGQGVRDFGIPVLFQLCFTAESATASGDNQSVSPEPVRGEGVAVAVSVQVGVPRILPQRALWHQGIIGECPRNYSEALLRRHGFEPVAERRPPQVAQPRRWAPGHRPAAPRPPAAHGDAPEHPPQCRDTRERMEAVGTLA